MSRSAPEGAEVRITYDAHPSIQMMAGEALVTTTGRLYVITAARRQLRGQHAGRWHLRAVVASNVGDEPLPTGVRVHPLIWNPRGRRRPG